MRHTEDLLTTPEVAELLGMHPRKVQRLAVVDKLPVRRKLPGSNGAFLFDRAEIMRVRRRASRRQKRGAQQ